MFYVHMNLGVGVDIENSQSCGLPNSRKIGYVDNAPMIFNSNKNCLYPLNSDLDIRFFAPTCSNFEITDYFSSKDIVVLCFDLFHSKSCYSFDGKIKHIVDSNSPRWMGLLAKYKKNLITVGSFNGGSELMERMENGTFIWSVVESRIFNPWDKIGAYSMATIPPSDMNEEYVLLIGGSNDKNLLSNAVFKFNGTWLG